MNIDKGVPIPPLPAPPSSRRGKGKWQVLLGKMEAGDSVGGLSFLQRRALYMRAKKMGVNVTIRKEGDSFRVWKLKQKED